MSDLPLNLGDSHQHAPGLASFAHRGINAGTGPSHAEHLRFGVVVARFNAAITSALFAGAIDVLLEAGVAPNHVAAVQVPGAIEIPLAAHELADTRHYAGIIALGCVIRGDTSHYDYVCGMVSDGCLKVQLQHAVPVGFGLITADTVDQARIRSVATGSSEGHNVGADAARATLEMAGLVRAIRGS
ncbi:MAG: 6,7-dimethyl-8-ribityllumazine synthase [Thermoleophilia bacterium]|nr:6,7-dimethyl-8-ribityllumazine synthase [Thermoleophilia bacterium]